MKSLCLTSSTRPLMSRSVWSISCSHRTIWARGPQLPGSADAPEDPSKIATTNPANQRLLMAHLRFSGLQSPGQESGGCKCFHQRESSQRQVSGSRRIDRAFSDLRIGSCLSPRDASPATVRNATESKAGAQGMRGPGPEPSGGGEAAIDPRDDPRARGQRGAADLGQLGTEPLTEPLMTEPLTDRTSDVDSLLEKGIVSPSTSGGRFRSSDCLGGGPGSPARTLADSAARLSEVWQLLSPTGLRSRRHG